MTVRRLCVLVFAAVCALAAGAPAPALARAHARASLPAIEREAMCVTCKVALNESTSPQANVERGYIKELIAKGEDEAQIKRALVAQFGPTVLALPAAHGFDLTVYLVPAAVVVALLAALALLLPRWRRRARERAGAPALAAPLSAADAARLESDLARFD
ncbi:MAG TPA: cytochrome c-type biogenesis protein CcmH [Solirubrobacteraceae bacterium]|nr:cytochrome c-type biogenesis protein CcmH [Solirubrobacteraceae bacterium]